LTGHLEHVGIGRSVVRALPADGESLGAFVMSTLRCSPAGPWLPPGTSI
jgi:hypothetical protein